MVEVVESVTDELVHALQHLVPQLTRSAPPVERDTVDRVVRSDACRLLIARDDGGRVVGALRSSSSRS